MAIALVTGIAGQDGAYLAQHLLNKGYQVHGITRGSSDLWRLQYLGISRQVQIQGPGPALFPDWVEYLQAIQPAEIYHLAANSSVSQSIAQPLSSTETDSLAILHILEACRLHLSTSKVFFAASAEIFSATAAPQNETSTLAPLNPYACSKAFGYHLCQTYRQLYRLFACSAILFNHESPLRGSNFVTAKIVAGLTHLKANPQAAPLQLGSLDSRRDWGYAPEFVQAMYLMLQQEQAEDFVLATGQAYSVRQFCHYAAQEAGFDLIWQTEQQVENGLDSQSGRILIQSDSSSFRSQDPACRIGDAAKADKILGWQAQTLAPQLATIMMQQYREK